MNFVHVVVRIFFVLSIASSFAIATNHGNCSFAPVSSYPYCNQALAIPDRVSDLLSRMNITEKIANLEHYNPGVPRLGVPSNQFFEALHGVNTHTSRCTGKQYKNNTGCATTFPGPTLLGATFNRSLWKEIATIISTEARAFKNQGITDLYYWTPNINLFRDPRWGRGQETPGMVITKKSAFYNLYALSCSWKLNTYTYNKFKF